MHTGATRYLLDCAMLLPQMCTQFTAQRAAMRISHWMAVIAPAAQVSTPCPDNFCTRAMQIRKPNVTGHHTPFRQDKRRPISSRKPAFDSLSGGENRRIETRHKNVAHRSQTSIFGLELVARAHLVSTTRAQTLTSCVRLVVVGVSGPKKSHPAANALRDGPTTPPGSLNRTVSPQEQSEYRFLACSTVAAPAQRPDERQRATDYALQGLCTALQARRLSAKHAVCCHRGKHHENEVRSWT